MKTRAQVSAGGGHLLILRRVPVCKARLLLGLLVLQDGRHVYQAPGQDPSLPGPLRKVLARRRLRSVDNRCNSEYNHDVLERMRHRDRG